MLLKLTVDNLCSEDLFGLTLNGASLHEETTTRDYGLHISAWQFDGSSANLSSLTDDHWGKFTSICATGDVIVRVHCPHW